MKAFIKEIIIKIYLVVATTCAFSLLLYFPMRSILVIFGKIITTSEIILIVVCVELFYTLCLSLHKIIKTDFNK